MLTISTYLAPSPIHGLGCFAGQVVEAGDLVWKFETEVDHILHGKPAYWDRIHAYGSHVKKGILVLPRDNGAWINFAAVPCLVEAERMNGEPCLRAARQIQAGEELTVPTSSDADAAWKLFPTKRLEFLNARIAK